MGTNITFTEQAFEEYLSWQGQDRKTLKKINALLKGKAHCEYKVKTVR
jgi:Txe/YoeB family toxin of Txe-Axe toxin-antitoxin module